MSAIRFCAGQCSTFALIMALWASVAAGKDAQMPAGNPDQKPGRLALEIGPDTTIYSGPLRDDGTVDYLAALNLELSAGVTNENNAFVALLEIMPIKGWGEEHRRQTFVKLGLPEQTGEEPGRFVPFPDFLNKPFAQVEWKPEERTEQGLEEYLKRVEEAKPEHERRYEEAQKRPWTAEEYPEIARWLEANREPLAALERAVRRSRYWAPLISPADASLLTIDLPHLALMRTLAMALKARANLRLANRDPVGAWRDVMTLQRLGRLPGHEPLFISGLVGMSIRSMASDMVLLVADHPDPTGPQARQMIEDLRSLPPMPDWRGALRGERLMLADMLIQLWAAAEDAERMEVLGDQLFPDGDWAAFGRILRHPLFDINRALRHCNQRQNELNAVYDVTPVPAMMRQMEIRSEQWNEWLDETADHIKEQLLGGKLIEDAKSLPKDQVRRQVSDMLADWVMALLWPVMDLYVFRGEGNMMMADLEPIALALAAYRAEHADYPPALDALVPDYLDALPIDRFSDRPLHYVLSENQVIVYSIGPDLEDDGGKDDLREGDLAIRLPRRMTDAEQPNGS